MVNMKLYKLPHYLCSSFADSQFIFANSVCEMKLLISNIILKVDTFS